LIERLPRTRFGAVLLPYSVPFERVLGAARKAEELGFDSIWISDHLQRGSLPVLECWTTISVLAGATSRIHLGSLASCNSFRNPALLAKMVATASQISKGRIDIGVGVGYDDVEHMAYGYRFPKLQERVDRLSESLKVMNALWRGKKVDFEGKHLHLRGAFCLPPPVGKPRIWVAGRSEAVLKAAGSSAAYGVNILPYSGTREKRRISSREELAEICKKIDSRGLKKSMYSGDGGVIIAPTAKEFSRRVEKAAKLTGSPASDVIAKLQNLSAVFGAVDECKEQVEALSSMGFEELMLIFHGWQHGDYSNLETFAEALIG
jgi:alkanesulfonate monooxygenase SsuD/methylene tetrahydromethanopterin reductase-like flavin-dependent oxidoreductase (luciferase family)